MCINKIVGGNNVIAGGGGVTAGDRKARCGVWVHAYLVQTGTDPSTGMDGIIVQGRSGGAGLKLPRGDAPAMSQVGKEGAAIQIRGQMDEQQQ